MRIRAVLFDLYGTLAHVVNAITDERASRFLVERGYEVYPQSFKAAWQYISFIEYPKHGYKDWKAYLRRVLELVEIKPDERTLIGLVRLYEVTEWKRFPDAKDALTRAKNAKLKTAIVTTIAKFKYMSALQPFLDKIDLLVDGYTFHCEKSNPKIYLKSLNALRVKPNEAVMIGDDINIDVLLPKGIGMKAILLDRTCKLSPESCKGADAIARNLNEAMDIVINWLSL